MVHLVPGRSACRAPGRRPFDERAQRVEVARPIVRLGQQVAHDIARNDDHASALGHCVRDPGDESDVAHLLCGQQRCGADELLARWPKTGLKGQPSLDEGVLDQLHRHQRAVLGLGPEVGRHQHADLRRQRARGELLVGFAVAVVLDAVAPRLDGLALSAARRDQADPRRPLGRWRASAQRHGKRERRHSTGGHAVS